VVPLGGIQRVHRGGGKQVVVEQPGQCRGLGRLGLLGPGQVGGVDAQQFVHPVPAQAQVLDQVRAGELVEQFVGTVERRAGEGGHRVRLDLRSGMAAEQPEGAGGVGG